MNIFALDKQPHQAAQYHCDKHVVKMILESGQMLSSAHWTLGLAGLGRPLKSFRRIKDGKQYAVDNLPAGRIPPWSLTHTGHPCTIWTAASNENYLWHVRLMRALLDEYTRRYNKKHKAESTYEWLKPGPPPNIPHIGLTDLPQCMPDDCKVPGDTITAYRQYYIKHKAYMAKWKLGNTPSWWSTNV